MDRIANMLSSVNNLSWISAISIEWPKIATPLHSPYEAVIEMELSYILVNNKVWKLNSAVKHMFFFVLLVRIINCHKILIIWLSGPIVVVETVNNPI